MAAKEENNIRASAKLQDFLLNLYVDMVGIVSLEDLQDTDLEKSALKLLPTARSIVALAAEIDPELLELTSPEKKEESATPNELFDRHIEHLRESLTRAANDIADVSRRAGLEALPLPSLGCPVDARSLESELSFRQAAKAAGLGDIGMSGLLVTLRFGPRVCLGACLTEAILTPTTAESSDSCCRYCNICVSRCPPKALKRSKDGEPCVIDELACLSHRQAANGCSECMRQCPVASPRYEKVRKSISIRDSET